MIKFEDEKKIVVQPCNCNLKSVFFLLRYCYITYCKFVKLVHKKFINNSIRLIYFKDYIKCSFEDFHVNVH